MRNEVIFLNINSKPFIIMSNMKRNDYNQKWKTGLADLHFRKEYFSEFFLTDFHEIWRVDRSECILG